MTPFFSVIIPLYNKSTYIDRTINSVLSQTFDDFEVIVIDDGSTDDGPEKVEAFRDPRIRLIRQENNGVSSARNRAIILASGRFIAFLDADDEWSKNKLKVNFEFIQTYPNCRWLVSGFSRFFCKREHQLRFSDTNILPDALRAMVEGLIVWTGVVVVRRDCFVPDCFFSVGVSRSEDREVWLKLACIYPEIGYIDENLATYYAGNVGGLTESAVGEYNFPILTMSNRLKPFSVKLPASRRLMLEMYLYKSIRSSLWNLWANNKLTENIVANYLDGHFNQIEIFILTKLAYLPVKFKKIYLYLVYFDKLVTSNFHHLLRKNFEKNSN